MDRLAGFLMLILYAVPALAALIYWTRFSQHEQVGLTGAVVKTVSTGGIALMVWSLTVTHPQSAPLWPLALGLTLGAAGDWFLARPGERSFLIGMAAFGAGHLAYAGYFLHRSARIGFDGLDAPEMLTCGVLLALILSTEVWLTPRTGALRWPVRVYVLLIGLMGLSLLLMPVTPFTGLIQIGGALFILSDLLLALRLFVVQGAGAKVILSLSLWPAYWLGQVLIAFGGIGFLTLDKG